MGVEPIPSASQADVPTAYTTDTIMRAAVTKVRRPEFQSRYAMRVNGLAMEVGSVSLFCTTRCHTCK